MQTADMKCVSVDGNQLVLVAEDHIDGYKLGVSGTDNVLIFDPSDSSIIENLDINFANYLEDIRDKLLLRKLHYEGEELGLVSSQ